jgi:hypothetical protein
MRPRSNGQARQQCPRTPLARLSEGPNIITGRAWSGAGAISQVEYSINGAEWQPARLTGPTIPGAWTRFEFDWEARPGEHELRSRATDERGNIQPDHVPYNEQGYLYNAVVSHPVVISS